jgi:hypothetical protein
MNNRHFTPALLPSRPFRMLFDGTVGNTSLEYGTLYVIIVFVIYVGYIHSYDYYNAKR